MKKMTLNGSWQMNEAGSTVSYSVNVPGSVLSALLTTGAIEDPYYRRNEYPTRELFWKDYGFSRTFFVDEALLCEENLSLVCDGVDTLADIYVNGTCIASTNNMHRTYSFPVKELLTSGENQIRVYLHSPLQYMENYEYAENKEVKYTPCGCMKGNHLIRKAHSMFGWDWGPQLVDAGIFREIRLEAWSIGRIEDVILHQEHTEDQAELSVKVSVSAPEKTQLSISISEEGSKKEVAKALLPFEASKASFTIEHPKLWWPNGYGEQNLYKVTISLLDANGALLETQEKIIGLRTLTVSRERDEWGREFAFMINGIKIFAMGGNYIPEDCVYSQITKERQEYLVRSMVRAHYNCVRVWGGGYYPSDDFYDLCDRYGLIVWQDLMYACNVYDVTEDFAENCRLEVIDNLKRLRHHASLGLICGNNEIESAWHHWDDFQGETLQLRADYIKLFEDVLPKAAKATAPDVFYWLSSPTTSGSFDDPDNENDGDTHYWAVWHGQLPFTDYKNHFFRFCSEFGFQSFPALKTVDTFAEKEDQNIFSRVCESHQKNDAANGKMLYYLSENFRYPATFSHLLYVSQILQGMAMKYGVEHWRRHRGRCMGALYWQVNDDWPAPSWSSIDYFGRWKALHYMACDFFAPVALSITTEGDLIELYIENETALTQPYTLDFALKTLKLQTLEAHTITGSIPAFSSAKILELPLSKELLSTYEEELIMDGALTLSDGSTFHNTETILPFKYLNLPKPQISCTVTEEDNAYVLTLTSDCFAAFVELDFDDADVIFSKNYFHMTDTTPYLVRIEKTDIYSGSFKDADDLKNRLKIRSIADTY